MLDRDSIIMISESDKRYVVLLKESVGDIVRVDFSFDSVTYYGKVLTMSSNGTLEVKVKGIYGAGTDESDLS